MSAAQIGDPRLPVRFWAKVDLGPASVERPELGPCWLWNASLDGSAYGFFRVAGVSIRVHRLAYTTLVGPIPAGLEIDHLCRVRRCANPAHLEPVTSAENTRRSPIALATINSAKTHCVRQHPYDAANTWRDPKGGRYCRACARIRQAAHRARMAGVA